jgi:BlaI family transcriptional regulator, penicillinase repressor
LDAIHHPIPTFNTVLSTIRKLEKDGYIGYKVYGKSHQYFAILKKDEYAKSIFNRLYHNILEGSSLSMMSYFMKAEKLDIGELQKMIGQIKKQEP